MSYKIVHTPHVCEKPNHMQHPIGTIIQCDECDQFWILKRLGSGIRTWVLHLNYTPPPKPEKQKGDWAWFKERRKEWPTR